MAGIGLITPGGNGTSSQVPVTTANSTTSYTMSAPAHGSAAYKLTLTGNCTFTITGGTAAEECTLDVYLVQDATGSRSVVWPANVSWSVAGAPVLSTAAGKMDVVTLVTLDGGTTFYGFLAASGVTAPTAPSAPTSLSVTQGNTQLILNWSAPASNNGATITNYKIYRGTSSGTETLLTTVGNVLTYTDTGLTNGTTYYYKVSAVNGVGEGAQSGEASGAPANITTIAADDFTAADTTTGLTGRSTPSGAKTWTRIGKPGSAGTVPWGIISNAAYKSSNSAGSIGVNAGVADCSVSADVTINTVNNGGGLVVRYVDGGNYVRATFSGGFIYLQAEIGSVQWTTIGSFNGSYVTGNTYNVKVVMSGSSYTVLVGGVQRITGTNANAGLLAATIHGLYADEETDITGRWDNFTITQP